jgi:hypothetical protein
MSWYFIYVVKLSICAVTTAAAYQRVTFLACVVSKGSPKILKISQTAKSFDIKLLKNRNFLSGLTDFETSDRF